MSSSSPPDPWREPPPRDPGAASSIWDRYAEQTGEQPATAPRGQDPGRSQEQPRTPRPKGDPRAVWGTDPAAWEPRTGDWAAPATWPQPPGSGWGQRQGGQQDTSGQDATRASGAAASDPYRRDPYQSQGYQRDAGYPTEAPPDDPFAMWGEPWEEASETEMPAVPRRRRRWPLLLLTGVAVVILAVIFVPGVRLLLDRAGGGGSPGPQAQAAGVSLGEPARDGALEFTARAVDCRVNSLGDTGITTDGVFCAVHLQVTNAGQQPVALDPALQRLFDQNGRALTVNQEWAALQDRSFAAQIPIGQTASGVLMFDAPEGTEAARLELHAAQGSKGVTVQVTGG